MKECASCTLPAESSVHGPAENCHGCNVPSEHHTFVEDDKEIAQRLVVKFALSNFDLIIEHCEREKRAMERGRATTDLHGYGERARSLNHLIAQARRGKELVHEYAAKGGIE
jgi:hypothetical protein